MDDTGLLVEELVKTTTELEWIEFKVNNKDPGMSGRDISALANSATHREASCAYMIWGVVDATHEIVETKFDYRSLKCGNEEIEKNEERSRIGCIISLQTMLPLSSPKGNAKATA